MHNSKMSWYFRPLMVQALILIIAHCHGYAKDDYNYDYYNYDLDGVEPPSFISRPQSFKVEVGQSVIFPCYAKNKGKHVLVINRKPYGVEKSRLLAVGNKKILQIPRIVVEESRLTISHVRPRDAGIYTCTFASAPYVVLEHSLNVQYAPSIEASLPTHHRVPKGSSVTLQCEAKGNPRPSIRWSRQEGPLPSGVQSAEGDSLTLDAVDRQEEGTYVCTADNGIGEPSSAMMTVVVEYPPVISTEKGIVRTGEGDSVELVCIVRGRPSPQVSWSRDGEGVPHKDHVTESQGAHRHVLVIKTVAERDFGAYVCIAENSQGQESAVIQLTGLPRQPRIASSPNGGESYEYTITYETESYYPITEYRIMFRKAQANLSTTLPGDWKDESRRVLTDDSREANTHHVLQHTLLGLNLATDYEAVVRVKNKYGWSSDSEIFSFSTRRVLAVQQSPFGNFFGFAAASALSLNVHLLLALLLSGNILWI